MKGVLGAEAIGLTPQEERTFQGFGLKDWANRRNRPWVAELLGFDLRYTYRREFVRPKIDYTHANSRGTRGVWFWWTLDSGRVYEARYRSTWTQWHHRWLTVTADGDLKDLTEEEVRQWLSDRSASTS